MSRPFPRSYQIDVVWEAKHRTPLIVFMYDGQKLVEAQCPLQEMLERVEGMINQAESEATSGTSGTSGGANTKQEISEKVIVVMNSEEVPPTT